MSIEPTGDATLEGVSLRSLPKVSLHDHLDGAVRPATILELADEVGLELPERDAARLGGWIR